ncbi:hypothetical protein LguiA_009125 [Lonicera macranthoides]
MNTPERNLSSFLGIVVAERLEVTTRDSRQRGTQQIDHINVIALVNNLFCSLHELHNKSIQAYRKADPRRSPKTRIEKAGTGTDESDTEEQDELDIGLGDSDRQKSQKTRTAKRQTAALTAQGGAGTAKVMSTVAFVSFMSCFTLPDSPVEGNKLTMNKVVLGLTSALGACYLYCSPEAPLVKLEVEAEAPEEDDNERSALIQEAEHEGDIELVPLAAAVSME